MKERCEHSGVELKEDKLLNFQYAHYGKAGRKDYLMVLDILQKVVEASATKIQITQVDFKEIVDLKAALKEAREVIEFYAGLRSWCYNATLDNETAIDSDDHYIPDGYCDERGGKRAREYLEKHK